MPSHKLNCVINYLQFNFIFPQFFGFQDGTIILVKYETALRENQIPNSFNIDTEKKLNDPCFRILWQTQLAFPVIGLSFGQLIHRSRSQNELSRNSNGKFNAENKDINENKSSEILSDQLAIVTTKSFHLFSLSFFNNLDTDQIDNIDQLVEKFSSYLY